MSHRINVLFSKSTFPEAHKRIVLISNAGLLQRTQRMPIPLGSIPQASLLRGDFVCSINGDFKCFHDKRESRIPYLFLEDFSFSYCVQREIRIHPFFGPFVGTSSEISFSWTSNSVSCCTLPPPIRAYGSDKPNHLFCICCWISVDGHWQSERKKVSSKRSAFCVGLLLKIIKLLTTDSILTVHPNSLWYYHST